VLSLPGNSRREDTLVLGHFRKWIVNHIDSWLAFAQKLGLELEMEDILLVSGCHRTKTWTNVSFNEIQRETQIPPRLQQATSSFSPAAANWLIPSEPSPGTAIRHGPTGEVRGVRLHGLTDAQEHALLELT